MKREIKFRAWDKVHECYLYDVQGAYDTLSGCVKYDDGEDAVYDEECFAGFLDNDQYVVEQYTGLHDKNGQEIYEGDVLDCVNGDVKTSDTSFYSGRCLGQVGFVGASFIVWPRPVVDGRRMHYGCEVLSDGLTKYTWENQIAAGESSVVGNIYENPELLEALKWQ